MSGFEAPMDVVNQTVDDLKQKREELERKIIAAGLQKEADIKAKLSDRKRVIAEDAALIPLIKEAEKTLEYYEIQNKQGLLVDKEDKEELENMRKLLKDLVDQREELVSKYDGVTGDLSSDTDSLNKVPEVLSRVWDEAEQENKKIDKNKKDIETKEAYEKKLAEEEVKIKALAKSFVEKFIESIKKEKELFDKINNSMEVINSSSRELRDILRVVTKDIRSEEIVNVLEFDNSKSYDQYIDDIESYRKSLGLFKLKEKSGIDSFLKHKDAVKKLKDLWFERNELKGEYDELQKGTDLAEEYKAIIIDAWKEEDNLKKEFSQENKIPNHLPQMLRDSIKDNMSVEAGVLKKKEDGSYKSLKDEIDKDRFKEREERDNYLFNRFVNITKSMHHIHYKNPEGQK